MKKITIVLCSLALVLLASCKSSDHKVIKIGIVKPIEHKALTEIVEGFSETLPTLFNQPFEIQVDNAQGDPNLERAILQKMRDQHYALILPIGVDATEMALSVAPNNNILSLASNFSQADRKKLNSCQIAVVHDEIAPTQLMNFIHKVYPKLTHMTLIHSSANKMLPEVPKVIAAGKQNHITVKPLMASTLPELYTIAQSLPANTQAILILRDNQIVSGVATLAKVAAQKHIPLISSDEGSVAGGAGFALGVSERTIGEEGAKLAAAILRGQSPCDLPIVEMTDLTVFVNSNALKAQRQSAGPIAVATQASDYELQIVDTPQAVPAK